jgi:hypothetical protein
MKTSNKDLKNKILSELKELDKEPVMLENGIVMKPSQCYSFSFFPKPHFLFNTNCSAELKDKLNSIFRKYYSGLA